MFLTTFSFWAHSIIDISIRLSIETSSSHRYLSRYLLNRRCTTLQEYFVHIICLTMQQKSLEKLVAVDHAMLYCTSTKYILLPKDEQLSLLPPFGASLLLLQHTYQHVQSHCSTQYLLSGHFSLEGIKNYNFIEISSSIQQVNS